MAPGLSSPTRKSWSDLKTRPAAESPPQFPRGADGVSYFNAYGGVLARSGKLTQLEGSRMQEMIGKQIHAIALLAG